MSVETQCLMSIETRFIVCRDNVCTCRYILVGFFFQLIEITLVMILILLVVVDVLMLIEYIIL